MKKKYLIFDSVVILLGLYLLINLFKEPEYRLGAQLYTVIISGCIIIWHRRKK